MSKLLPMSCAVLALVTAISLTGCSKKEDLGAAAASANSGSGERNRKAFDVRTQPVETRRVTYEIKAVGGLIEENRFEIPARVAGVAENVNFSEGDYVTTGQELCRIDYERHRMEVRQAESNVSEKEAALQRAIAAVANVERETSTSLSTARVNLELAQAEYQRRTASGAGTFTSSEERDQFEARYRQAQNNYLDALHAANTEVALATAQAREAEAALETARAQLGLVNDTFDRAVVKAPIAGVIQTRDVVEGQFVSQGDQVALMVQGDPLRLRFTVPESRAANLQKDMELTFSVPAYPDRTFSGQVYDIGAFADENTREVVCWARVNNHDSQLKPGFFTHVNLLADSRDEAIVVPLGAILPTELGMTAYVVEDGIAVRRAVQTGLQVTGDAIEILDGLQPGEQLVVEGMSALQQGVPVNVLPPVNVQQIEIQDSIVSTTEVSNAGAGDRADTRTDTKSTSTTVGG